MKKTGLWALGLIVTVSLSACGTSKSTVPAEQASASTTKEVPAAEALYKQGCISCHGVNLQGVVGPNLQKVGAELSRLQILSKIENGGGGMPSFKKRLDTNEINALAEWLSLKK
jgi:mono/diheme cytochrome c family protein